MQLATPIEALTLIALHGPIHHSDFPAFQEYAQREINKWTLRVLHRRGWIHTCIAYAWVTTNEGDRKAEAVRKET